MHLCIISELSDLYYFPPKGVHLHKKEIEAVFQSIYCICCWITVGDPSRCRRVTHYENNMQIKYSKEPCTVQVMDNLHMCIIFKSYPNTSLHSILSIEKNNKSKTYVNLVLSPDTQSPRSCVTYSSYFLSFPLPHPCSFRLFPQTRHPYWESISFLSSLSLFPFLFSFFLLFFLLVLLLFLF